MHLKAQKTNKFVIIQKPNGNIENLQLDYFFCFIFFHYYVKVIIIYNQLN